MKILDLLRMSAGSLWKRKVRTILTVLGVVVGTASIVVMVSLGLGLNKSSMEQIEKYGGLTTITVYESSGGDMSFKSAEVAVAGGSTSSPADKKLRLDNKALEAIAALEHVEIVSPVLEVSALAKYGSYEGNLNLKGMSVEALQKMNIELSEGSLPDPNASKLEFVYGNQILADFTNTKTNDSYWMSGKLPDIDLMKDPVFVIFDMDAYYQSQNPGENTTPVAPPKKYLVEACGLVAGDMEEYNNNSWSVFCDIETLKAQLKRVFKNKAIPGQPTTSSGKPYKEIYYNSIYVNVDDINALNDVQAAINEMGYQASSNSEWVESTKEQFGYIQAVLGGIGAVSLFVAAIGITNTMMMSIYERTKEIGVMKVLGCDLNNIQIMFLLEAGYIGFIGGCVGIIFSFLISFIINTIVNNMAMEMQNLSYIPPWLAFSAVIFAVLVGMVAGFFPSLRAMRLSPLAAIRSE